MSYDDLSPAGKQLWKDAIGSMVEQERAKARRTLFTCLAIVAAASLFALALGVWLR